MKLYNNIDDLPLYNYYMIDKSGDLRWLLYDFDLAKEDDIQLLLNTWDDIQYQITGFKGVSDQMQIIAQKQRELMIMRIDNLIEGKKNETFIMLKNKEIESMSKVTQVKENNLLYLISSLEIFLKFQIDFNKTSVSRFLCYLTIMENAKPN